MSEPRSSGVPGERGRWSGRCGAFGGPGRGFESRAHPRFARCRSARSVRKAGCCGSCGCSATGSPATSTSSGPTWPRASGSAAPPRAGSARPTGSTAPSRSPSCSTTRRSRSGFARRVGHIVAHQRPDGWYAPYPEDAGAKPYDLWAILLVNKALVQYHEATGDARVLEAVRRSLKALLAGLARTPLFDWGRFRWYEGLVPALYVYERTGEAWLLELARTLRAQGVDFEALYRTEDVTLADASPGALEVDEARRQHGHGHQGVRPLLAARPAARRPRLRAPDDRDPRPAPRPGDRDVLGRRVPRRQEPAPGHGAVRRGRVHVLAGDAVLGLRRSLVRRSARARGLQRPARDLRARHVVPPVRPAGEPGAVHGQPRAPVHHQRPRVEPLRPRAQLRLLHREHAPGLAEARRASVDEDARTRAWSPRPTRRAA